MVTTAMDAIIATQVDQGLKTCAMQFAHSAVETSSPQVRDAFAKASQDSIRRQQQLYGLMEQRGWYVPPVARQEDIQDVISQLQTLTMETPPVGVR